MEPKNRGGKAKGIIACWECPSTANLTNGISHASWRVIYDPLQWILERQRGQEWRPKSFCVTRDALLRCVREKTGGISADALEKLQRLPEWHLDKQEGAYHD
jgi:hypothetical protein